MPLTACCSELLVLAVSHARHCRLLAGTPAKHAGSIGALSAVRFRPLMNSVGSTIPFAVKVELAAQQLPLCSLLARDVAVGRGKVLDRDPTVAICVEELE